MRGPRKNVYRYIFALDASYEKVELTGLSWIPVETNPPDTLTKNSLGEITPLWQLMSTKYIDVDALGWASHTITHHKKVVGG